MGGARLGLGVRRPPGHQALRSGPESARLLPYQPGVAGGGEGGRCAGGVDLQPEEGFAKERGLGQSMLFRMDNLSRGTLISSAHVQSIDNRPVLASFTSFPSLGVK